MGKATEYVIKVFEHSEGSDEIYGPYSWKQAVAELRRVERWIAQEQEDAARAMHTRTIIKWLDANLMIRDGIVVGVHIDVIRNYCEDAVVLDLDMEEHGNPCQVGCFTIDWDRLEKFTNEDAVAP